MAALGQLIVYGILFLLGFFALVSFILTFKVDSRHKPLTVLGSLLFGYACISYKSCLTDSYLNQQEQQVGVYYLTNYHNCDSCILELKEDLTYTVKQGEKILEKSNWHYESGDDYWITYLDNNHHQLGYGDYEFKNANSNTKNRR